jgi:small subunit ribosomal protein S20
LANLHSAQKRIRSNTRKRIRNRLIRSRTRSVVASARSAIPESTAPDAVRKAVSELDRAAGKGVIHKNNAARRKSRLMKQLRTTPKAPATK